MDGGDGRWEWTVEMGSGDGRWRWMVGIDGWDAERRGWKMETDDRQRGWRMRLVIVNFMEEDSTVINRRDPLRFSRSYIHSLISVVEFKIKRGVCY